MDNLTILINSNTPKSFLVAGSYVNANDVLTVTQEQFNSIESFWREYVTILNRSVSASGVPSPNDTSSHPDRGTVLSLRDFVVDDELVNATCSDDDGHIQRHDEDLKLEPRADLINAIKNQPKKHSKK